MNEGASLKISGGTFAGEILASEGDVLITGGCFKTDISEYINTESHIVRERIPKALRLRKSKKKKMKMIRTTAKRISVKEKMERQK